MLMDVSTLRAATGDFAENNKLGEGGFGAVYKVEETAKHNHTVGASPTVQLSKNMFYMQQNSTTYVWPNLVRVGYSSRRRRDRGEEAVQGLHARSG
uniref:Protein kinase domain-containing protein n=1 Tax=Aegilops tauschii subsp. strangulata TaxID=200361 RepID=A0A453T8I1_AEGTS